MRSKKITALVFSAVLALNMAACASDSSSSTAETSSAAQAEQSSSTPSEGFKTTTDGSARISVEQSDFLVGGKKLWFNGVNAPWIKWNDFGGSFSFMEWNDHFAKLHENGVNCARVWISCNGEVGMDIADDGTFTGATEQFWADMDEFFSIAEANQIYIMATVQSFDHYKDDDNVDDSQEKFEAWRNLIQDGEKTDAYIDNFIVPLVERYGSSDYFWSVDLCNEPDWIYENKECGNIGWEHLSSYYAKASAAIHEKSDVLVTVGMGMPKYNSDQIQGNVIGDDYLKTVLGDSSKYNKDLAFVDFYSTHWYPWEEGSGLGNPFKQTPEEFKIETSKPIVIGECPGTPKNATLEEQYEAAYSLGYDGVLAWKTSGQNDGNGLIDDIVPATSHMAEAHSDEVFPLSAG